MKSFHPSIELSNRQKIARAAGIVSSGAVVVGVVTFLKDMTVGMSFGTSDSMDAMLLAYSVPFFMGTVALAVIQTTLIPIYSQIKVEGDDKQLQSFINKVFSFTASVLIGITIILFLAAPQIIRWIANDRFTDKQVQLSLTFIRLLLPIIPCMGFYGLLGGIFYAEKKFYFPIFVTFTSPVIILMSVMLGKGQWGILSLGAGITLGWLLQFLLINYFFSRYYFHLKLDWALNDSLIHQFTSLSWPLLIGTFFSGATVIIDRTMATSLPTGSISALDYADRINFLAIGAFSALQVAVFPFFADLASQFNYKQLVQDFKQTISLLCFLLAPFILLAILFSHSLVALIFQRGEFDLAATKLTSQAVIGYMAGLLPMMIGMISVRLAQALKLHKFIGFQGMLNPLFKIILNLLLIPIFGLMGISLATSGMYFLGLIIVLVGVFRYLQIVPTLSDFIPYIKIIISLLGSAGFMFLLYSREKITNLTIGSDLIDIILIIVLGIIVYWIGCFLLKLEEARAIPLIARKIFCKTIKFGR